MRTLTQSEIRRLEEQGCSAEEWTRIEITDEQSLEAGIFSNIDFTQEPYSKVTPVILAETFSEEQKFKDIPRVRVIKKPLCSLKVYETIAGDKASLSKKSQNSGKNIDFTIPDAKILVVDDNKVNLRVAEKLLAMFGCSVDKAYSGKEAMELVSEKDYDIIFMDHMMPELDGIDTTRLIRRFHPKMSEVPIIALTANAMDDVKKLFLNEGMNDFIAKPIELSVLSEKIKTWLPAEKIIYNK